MGNKNSSTIERLFPIVLCPPRVSCPLSFALLHPGESPNSALQRHSAVSSAIHLAGCCIEIAHISPKYTELL